uniref:Thyroxine-binding globulin n=1 Tax=Sinocyclocheilus anshuiensis TaxID=1608454 RepID=A0A671SPA9_9TELE
MPDYQSKNIFFSPFSVSMALSELSLGAGGETKKQLLSGIGHNSLVFSTEEMHQMFHSLLEEINQRTGVDIDVGSALYVSDKLKPLPEFGNAIVSDRFKNVTLSSKGKWDKSFDPSKTRQSTFRVDAETTVPVQIMYQYASLKVYYDADLTSKVLCLDYNDSFSMFLVVPHIDIFVEAKTIKDLEMAISRQHTEKWRTAVRKRKVNIYVPKLSLKTSHSLKDILKGLGMADMVTNEANFTGISEEMIFISKALHKATLNIDEKGSTAAAVTRVSFGPMSYNPMLFLRFDSPFMIFITGQKKMTTSSSLEKLSIRRKNSNVTFKIS